MCPAVGLDRAAPDLLVAGELAARAFELGKQDAAAGAAGDDEVGKACAEKAVAPGVAVVVDEQVEREGLAADLLEQLGLGHAWKTTLGREAAKTGDLKGTIGVRHLGGRRLPTFIVHLDTADGTHAAEAPGMVRLVISDSDSDPQVAMIYEALQAGHYVIEGGYPCWVGGCTSRHGPLAVLRCDDPPVDRVVWTIAEKYR